MTTEQILQYNKMCAEFLGWKYSQNYESFDDYYNTWEKELDGVWYKESDLVENSDKFRTYYVKVDGICLKNHTYLLKFDSDYNLIMEVVEAIEKLYDEFHGKFIVYISSNNCTIQGSKVVTTPENFHPTYFADHYGKDKQEAVVQAINNFLIWYNNDRK